MAPTLHVRPVRALTVLALAGLVFFLLASSARAQTGTISGVVVDEDTGETLIGVNVVVDALGTGAATGLDGDYRITGLAPGSYDLTFSYVGYRQQKVTGVDVAAGQTTTLDLELGEETLELEEGGEVVVEATALLNNEAGLLRQRQKSAAVSDAISAETISQSGSSDAADAMERVTGASVQDGKYVSVRGLGDRYANTQLNSATLPTADPDRRAVQFDLFPSAFLENIVTLKTFTPDKPGSFSGGLVDINTRSFPDGFSASLSFSSGLSTQIAPGGTLLTDPAADVSYFGTADRLDIPDALLDGSAFPAVSNQEIFNPETDPDRLATIQANEALVDYFSARSVAPSDGTAAPNFSLGGSVGNRVSLFGNDLGFVLGVTADRGVGSYEEGTIGRYDTAGSEGAPRLLQRRLDQRSTVESSLGGIASATYRLSARHEVGVNGMFSRSAESEARVISGLAPIPIGSEGDNIFVTDRVAGYTERRLGSGQLRGRHQLPALAGITAEWRANYAVTQIEEPDLRFFANANLDGEQLVVGGASLNNTLHFFRTSTEDLGGTALDLTVPSGAIAGLPIQVKVGGLYETTGRESRERRFEIRSEGVQLGGEDAASVESFFGEENTGVIEVRDPNPFDPQQRSTYVIGHRLIDNTQGNNQYDGGLDVTAAYAMAEVPLLARLRMIAGVRYEQTNLSLDVVDPVTGAAIDTENPELSGRIKENDVLPSFNLIYGLSADMNLRLAATRTLARPTFREIAPFSSFDFATDGPLLGNPDLDRTLITNLDLRWEWFNRPGSIAAVSGYYKYLDRPIERAIVDITNNINRFQNVESATIYGLEIELRQRLETLGGVFGGGFLSDLSVGGNLTLTQSEITISQEELDERRFVDANASNTRPLQGQSPYLVNLDLAYDNYTSGTTAGLYFNVFGRRLSRVGVPDVYESPSPQLDFVASQQLSDQFKVKLSVKNIFAQGSEQIYDFPSSTLSAINGATPVYQAYDRGTSFSLGISFSPRFGGGAPAVPASPTSSSPISG